MRTTTVTWLKGHVAPEDLEAKKQRMYDAAISIAGESYKDEINQTSNEENGSITVTRAWPDAEKAQAWVDYVLSEGADSAQINPE
jgi:hypothetical protein